MVNLDYTRAQVCTRTGVCDDVIVQVFWLWCGLDYTHAQVCTRTGVCDDLIVQVFWLWCGNAVYHSILLFWMTVVALEQGRSDVITLHAS